MTRGGWLETGGNGCGGIVSEHERMFCKVRKNAHQHRPLVSAGPKSVTDETRRNDLSSLCQTSEPIGPLHCCTWTYFLKSIICVIESPNMVDLCVSVGPQLDASNRGNICHAVLYRNKSNKHIQCRGRSTCSPLHGPGFSPPVLLFHLVRSPHSA